MIFFKKHELLMSPITEVSTAPTQENEQSEAQKDRTPIKEFSNGFTAEQTKAFRQNYNLASLLKGGDDSVWWSLRTSELFNTAVLPVRQETRTLKKLIKPEIGKIKAETKNFGTISLDEFMVHPESYAMGYMVAHKGTIVYENYQGLKPTDYHVWMSNAKTIASLILDKLMDEGKVDQRKTIGYYMPDFRDTAWENIKVIDVWDMTPGLTSEENDKTRADPNSIATRSFLAEFGLPYNNKHEGLVDVLKDAKYQNPPGTKFEYGSPVTQMLVLLAEAITNEPFAQLVDKHVWSKVHAQNPLLLHLSPDGVAATHGLVSSTLSDMIRFGMLYTPSWNKVASEKVVSDQIIERIRFGVRSKEFYRNGFDGPTFMSRLNNDEMISNSRQWDAVWADGDFWKSGLQSQGIYVSPSRDLVICFFSTNVPDDSAHRFLRNIATSGLFDS